MAEISAKQVKDLRDKTSAGMADCKKALEATAGDMEKAIAWLREKGVASAAKRADREAKEGTIVFAVSPDQKQIAMLELNCETDFVAKGDNFLNAADAFVKLALKEKTKSVDEINSKKIDNEVIADAVVNLGAKLGEKIVINRVVYRESTGVLVPYVHLGSKLASFVELEGKDAEKVGREIAMQVAAYNPMSIDRDGVPKEEINKEVEILKQQAINDGKPVQVVEKIVAGRLEKFYQEVVLLEQAFVKDSSKSVKDVIKDSGGDVKIKYMIRLQVGEK